MASRMDKYNENKNNSAKISQSRLSKNEKLYEQLYTNKVFTEFNNSNFDNVIELNNFSNNELINKREQYQKIKTTINSEDESTNRNYSYESLKSIETENKEPEKNYNINDVIENAKKNRIEDNEIEKKRRQKSVEYSILSDLSQEKVKEYHESKQKKLTKDEEENLEELIHTITSNSLRKKIDDELLSDLLPTEESETLVSQELFDKIEEIESKTRDLRQDLEDEKMDQSFYTKSMDLSNEDFEIEEDYSFIDEKKKGILPKILLIMFILIVISIIVYVVYRFI